MAPRRSRAPTGAVDPAPRCGAGAEACAPFFDEASAGADPAPGALELTHHRLGVLTLVAMAAPARTLRRTPEMAFGQGCDDLLFLFRLDGTVRPKGPGGAVSLGRLQGVLLDLAQPAALVVGPARATGLILPRALVAAQVPNLAALHGAVLDMASDPVIRLFFTCVQDLAETAHTLSDDQLPRVTRAVAVLCVAALRRLEPGLLPGSVAPAPRRQDGAGPAPAGRRGEIVA